METPDAERVEFQGDLIAYGLRLVRVRPTVSQTAEPTPPPATPQPIPEISYSPVSSPLSFLDDLLDLLPSPPPFLAGLLQEDPAPPSDPSDEEPLDLSLPRSSFTFPESPPCFIQNAVDMHNYLITQSYPECRIVVYIPGINHPFSAPIATLLPIRPSSLEPRPPTLHIL
ncbi:PREDICTED: extensin-like [Cyphomyrmex costatus]|uniref:extensin-like n=1 Tax=Cyphomyrmex costatus TaxID=456900 RepID=UPI0008523779|nr:PREDICTED: extensin-like [Cyphomyrmex costatus]